MKWLPYPMVRITGFFIGGILLGIYCPDIISERMAWAAIAVLVIFFFVLVARKQAGRASIFLGIIGLVSIFLLGYNRLLWKNELRRETHVSNIKERIEVCEMVVRSVPEEKINSWKVEVEILQCKAAGKQWQPVIGRVLLYLSKRNHYTPTLRYGDRILVHGEPRLLSPPMNPGEFDFKKFLSYKNISHQLFITQADIISLPTRERKGLIYYSHEARRWSLQKLAEFIPGKSEQAVASALVLGVTDAIDDDTISAYAASGALHVLAVSGMHVGIIYAIILVLFKPTEKYRNSRWVVAIVSVLLLWAFAFITGLSPSVLRAVAMFSFVAMARPLGIRTNIYNTLAASAFVLLVYNPFLIMSVGFQLSYLAVFGIVYLQRPIYRWWEVHHRVGDWIWQMTCISIAAQLATFALGLLYFHQFPTYFLVSNLFVIPLSTLVLVGGIILLALSLVTPLAIATGWALAWLIKFLNWIVFTTESLPYSLVNNIHITVFQCWLLFGILAGILLLFQYKKITWLYFSFVMAIIFSITDWAHFFSTVNQRQWISYNIRGHQAIEFLFRGRSYFISDSALRADREQIRFHIQPNRLRHGVADVCESIPFQKKIKGIYYLRWNHQWIARIDSPGYQFPQHCRFDQIVVSHNSLNKKLLDQFQVGTVIFDGSNTTRYVRTMKQQAEAKSIAVYATDDQSAFIQ
ncbi:MAG: ComEC family competence protein [Bacteroidetes bacterium]|nr:ComEC family competence protein [Bacteroidota bacterium]MBS1541707.1 ComEC family competence protein [Bacteroidota bacterium]